MTQLSAQSIIKELESRINSVEISPERVNTGEVVYVGDGIATVVGLHDCLYNEMIEFASGARGVALNLEEHSVGIVILDGFSSIKEGEIAKTTGRVMEVPVGPELIGRVVDAIGNPIDGQGPLKAKKYYPTERVASGVMSRKPVHEPLQTGVKAIDALVPIGRGQRELIIGDRQTGKTQVAIDTIINQKDENIQCIYVAIGQKDAKIATIVDELGRAGAMEYTTIVVAGASSPAAMQWLAPYTGCAMAEYFMLQGEHSLIIYDDLTKHANAYREMSLLLRRPPGREAYPGDVFYLHSKLLERAAKLSDKNGAGSMTALPIIETQAGDQSGYIPTNVISITDGQIMLDKALFNSGVKPAIAVGSSVSRVGRSAQVEAMKEVSGKLRLELAQFRELEAFAQFASDLDRDTREQISRGQRMVEILKQPAYSPVPVEKQACLIYVGGKGYIDPIKADMVSEYEQAFFAALENDKQILKNIKKSGKMTEKDKEKIERIASSVQDQFMAKK